MPRPASRAAAAQRGRGEGPLTGGSWARDSRVLCPTACEREGPEGPPSDGKAEANATRYWIGGRCPNGIGDDNLLRRAGARGRSAPVARAQRREESRHDRTTRCSLAACQPATPGWLLLTLHRKDLADALRAVSQESRPVPAGPLSLVRLRTRKPPLPVHRGARPARQAAEAGHQPPAPLFRPRWRSNERRAQRPAGSARGPADSIPPPSPRAHSPEDGVLPSSRPRR